MALSLPRCVEMPTGYRCVVCGHKCSLRAGASSVGCGAAPYVPSTPSGVCSRLLAAAVQHKAVCSCRYGCPARVAHLRLRSCGTLFMHVARAVAVRQQHECSNLDVVVVLVVVSRRRQCSLLSVMYDFICFVVLCVCVCGWFIMLVVTHVQWKHPTVRLCVCWPSAAHPVCGPHAAFTGCLCWMMGCHNKAGVLPPCWVSSITCRDRLVMQSPAATVTVWWCNTAVLPGVLSHHAP